MTDIEVSSGWPFYLTGYWEMFPHELLGWQGRSIITSRSQEELLFYLRPPLAKLQVTMLMLNGAFLNRMPSCGAGSTKTPI